MDRSWAAADILKQHLMDLKTLTQEAVCSIIPPLKASAQRNPAGKPAENILSTLNLRRNPESPHSCSQPTTHI